MAHENDSSTKGYPNNDYANQPDNTTEMNMQNENMQQASLNQMMQNSSFTQSATGENIELSESFSDILSDNIGNYVLVQFLIGTGSLVDKEGFLYTSGVNFITIYEPIEDRYVVCDLYSVKFVTIYPTPPIGSMTRQGSSRLGRNYINGGSNGMRNTNSYQGRRN